MAEGSDQLAARVSQEFREIQLIVPLPKTREVYLADFSSKDGRDGFRNLIAPAAEVIQVPASDELQTPYQALGEYLTSQADTLIAIWNGMFNQNKGETSDVVQSALIEKFPGEVNGLENAKHFGEIEVLR